MIKQKGEQEFKKRSYTLHMADAAALIKINPETIVLTHLLTFIWAFYFSHDHNLKGNDPRKSY